MPPPRAPYASLAEESDEEEGVDIEAQEQQQQQGEEEEERQGQLPQPLPAAARSASPPPPSAAPQESPANAAPANASDGFSITIKTLTGQHISVCVPTYREGVTPVEAIKRQVERINGVPPTFQRLIYAGRELADDRPISSYGLDEGSIVHIVLRQALPTAAVADAAVQQARPAPARPQGLAPAPGRVFIAPPGAPGPARLPGESEEAARARLMRSLEAGGGGEAAARLRRDLEALDGRRLRAIFQLSLIVKLFAVIDALFVVIFALSYPPLFLAVILPVMGWRGAHQYDARMLRAYILYLFASIVVRLVLLSTGDGAPGKGFILILGVLVSSFVLRVVHRFTEIVQTMTQLEREALIVAAEMQQQGVAPPGLR